MTEMNEQELAQALARAESAERSLVGQLSSLNGSLRNTEAQLAQAREALRRCRLALDRQLEAASDIRAMAEAIERTTRMDGAATKARSVYRPVTRDLEGAVSACKEAVAMLEQRVALYSGQISDARGMLRDVRAQKAALYM